MEAPNPAASTEDPGIGVLDFGIGNVSSILSMFRRLMVPARRVTVADEVSRHRGLVLPGVGAFDPAMERLNRSGLRDPLEDAVLARRVPLLGICLGMQLLADRSEEGRGAEAGLGWISGEVRHMRPLLPSDRRLPVMGWAEIAPTRPSALFHEDDRHQRFYFVHSLAFHSADDSDVAATVDHGAEVCAAVQRDNIWGTQFHPEKSHRFGMQLLRRFAEIGVVDAVQA